MIRGEGPHVTRPSAGRALKAQAAAYVVLPLSPYR